MIPPCTTATLSFKRRLLRKLGVKLHARLGVVTDQLDLPPDQSAAGVCLFNSQGQCINHGLAIDVETARKIEKARNSDRLFGEGSGREGASGQRCGSLHECPAIDAHVWFPPVFRWFGREIRRPFGHGHSIAGFIGSWVRTSCGPDAATIAPKRAYAICDREKSSLKTNLGRPSHVVKLAPPAAGLIASAILSSAQKTKQASCRVC